MAIFVDTGAWFAASVPSDPHHAAASAFLRANRERLLTSDYIYDELHAMAFAKRLGLLYFRADICIRLILDPQLHEPHTAGQKPGDPSRAVDDHIERVKHARDR